MSLENDMSQVWIFQESRANEDVGLSPCGLGVDPDLIWEKGQPNSGKKNLPRITKYLIQITSPRTAHPGKVMDL
jgi:hypothetical protein